ncbi:MAG: hypothetical protein Tsb0015_03750 [Simkaniaceae bacterium]
MIITIDGPSGTGKSTAAKKVAKKLQFQHLDTGAMYRAFAWYITRKKISPENKKLIKESLKEFKFYVHDSADKKKYLVGKEDVTVKIRTDKISQISSKISAYPFVREKMVAMQRKIAKNRDIVCEGRDMGTVVFPKADLKIFLNAEAEVRAQRRWKEEAKDSAVGLTLEKVLESQSKRDAQDIGREASPLKKARDAVEIDTTNLSAEEVCSKILQLAHQRQKRFFGISWMAPRMHFFYRMVLCLVWIVFKIFYRLRVFGREHFYTGEGIIAANHASYFDPPVVAISAPEEIAFLARKSLFKPFIFGRLIRALNSYPVSGNATDISVFKTIISLLEHGKKVLLFPEGSRSFNGEIQPFKEGISFLMLKAKSPVIPTYVHGTHEIWGRHKKLPRWFGKTACVFGSPIYFHEFSHLPRKDALKQITIRLQEALSALKTWYENGAKGSPP